MIFSLTSTLSEEQTHDFAIHITKIEFDFSDADWDEDFETEKEWINYQQELAKKYSNFIIRFPGYELPQSDEEDETIAEYYDSTHCCEEGYYYRILENWIDENIGFCLLDLEYSIQKIQCDTSADCT